MRRFLLPWLVLGLAFFPLFGQTPQGQESPPKTPLPTSPTQASPQSPSPTEVQVIARYKEQVEDMVFAVGDVEISYKEITVFADRVEVNVKTKDVYAEGNVAVHLAQEVISVEKLRFNLESSRGEMENVQGMIQPTVFYQAQFLERKNEILYSLEKARITSCAQPNPRWMFSCAKANFKKHDYVEMWSALLTIKKIPVFYFPYMKYPVDQERATGFLMPQLGYSATKGFFYSQDFYWAIRRNMDATLDLDTYSSRGLGAGLEYRYLFGEGMGGQLNLFYFRFKDDPVPSDPSDAYIIRFNHNQPLPLSFKLVADVDYQSSFDFLREFDNNFKRAVVSNRRSQVYLSRSWSYFNFNLRAARFETFNSNTNSTFIRNSLPEFSLSSSKIKLFSPFYFSFSSQFQRWESGTQAAFEAGKQKYSTSFDFKPSLTYPFTVIPWMTLTTTAEVRMTYYFQTYEPGTKNIVNEPILARIYSMNLALQGPVFYRIYNDSEQKPKLKHIVEPSFAYRYDSPADIADRVVTSWIYYRNHYFRYGLTNRFLVKQKEMAREVLTVGINQTFYLEPDQGPLRTYVVNGRIPSFSDISGDVRFYPGRSYSLDFSIGFNPYYKSFSRLRLGANFGSPNDLFFFRVNWYKSINPYKESASWNRHQINLYSGVKIPALSLEAEAEMDYNIEQSKMLYTAFRLVHHYQCLDFDINVKIFYFRDKPELQFQFSFGLGNIGKTTDFLGGIGF